MKKEEGITGGKCLMSVGGQSRAGAVGGPVNRERGKTRPFGLSIGKKREVSELVWLRAWCATSSICQMPRLVLLDVSTRSTRTVC